MAFPVIAMPTIEEQPHRINPTEDWPVQFQCGCKVVFTGESLHHGFTFDVCAEHVRDLAARLKLVKEAKRELAYERLRQPPM